MSGRFKRLEPDEMTVEQKEVAQGALAGKRGRLTPPLNVLLRSPAVAGPIERLGAYARFEGVLPERLKELVVLFCTQRWKAAFPLAVHRTRAAEAGINPASVEQIAAGDRPTELRPDEALIYGFCRALLEDTGVSDSMFSNVIEAYGEQGVADLIGLMGYYFALSMAHKVDTIDSDAAGGTNAR